jgi:hypothetical protein
MVAMVVVVGSDGRERQECGLKPHQQITLPHPVPVKFKTAPLTDEHGSSVGVPSYSWHLRQYLNST